jgi:sugar lactone lactonase YvrE
VAVNARGDLFIADLTNNVVEEVSPAGRLSVVAGNGKRAVGSSGGLAVDAHGDLFISDGYVVKELSPAGRLSVVAGNGTQGQAPPAPGPATKRPLSPGGLAVNAHGDLFISDGGAGWGVVVEVSPAGKLSVVAGNSQEGDPTPGPATRSSLREPGGLAVSASGDLYIADTANFVVEKVTF